MNSQMHIHKNLELIVFSFLEPKRYQVAMHKKIDRKLCQHTWPSLISVWAMNKQEAKEKHVRIFSKEPDFLLLFDFLIFFFVNYGYFQLFHKNPLQNVN